MKKKESIKKLLYTLILFFIIIISYFVIPFSFTLKNLLFPYLAIFAFIFLVLGGLLVYKTIKSKIKGKPKWFLILAGGSPILAFTSAILHGLVYGLMMYFFGQDFWGQGDEAFFFILALIVSPILFLIGTIGSLILIYKKNNIHI